MSSTNGQPFRANEGGRHQFYKNSSRMTINPAPVFVDHRNSRFTIVAEAEEGRQCNYAENVSDVVIMDISMPVERHEATARFANSPKTKVLFSVHSSNYFVEEVFRPALHYYCELALRISFHIGAVNAGETISIRRSQQSFAEPSSINKEAIIVSTLSPERGCFSSLPSKHKRNCLFFRPELWTPRPIATESWKTPCHSVAALTKYAIRAFTTEKIDQTGFRHRNSGHVQCGRTLFLLA
jgi:hypothetical protein